MSFIPIQTALQRNGGYPRGAQSSLSRGEKILLTIVGVILAIGLTVAVIWGYYDQKQFNAHQRQAQQSWDAGIGRPDGVKVEAGKTMTAPATVNQVSQYWDSCAYKTCWFTDLQHYPMAYPVGWMDLDHGCYTDNSDRRTDQIVVASTLGGGTYSVTLDADGKTLTICTTTERHEDDQLVIWTDSPLLKGG